MLCKSNDAVELYIYNEIKRLKKENEILSNWIKAGRDIPRCVVCGKPIENVSIQRKTRPYLWDCRECFRKKPRKIISLEFEFGIDIVDILKETTRRYGNIKAQCAALGVSIPYFYTIVDKYCGPGHLEFMARYSTGKRKETYANKIRKKL
jgi:ribosomal protein S14